MKRETILLGLLAILGACAMPKVVRPFSSTLVVPAVPVAAPFDRTWEAAVEWFASRSITIRTIDKSSGLMIAEMAGALANNKQAERPTGDYTTLVTYADCGIRDGVLYNATKTTYNVFVAKDGSGSRFQANAKYEQDGSGVGNSYFVCRSSGRWESEIQQFVKQKAEAAK